MDTIMNIPAHITSHSRAISILVISALVLVCLAGLKLFGAFLAPLFLAFTLVVLLYPLLRYLMSKGISKPWAIIIIVAGVLVLFGSLFTVVYLSVNQLLNNIPEYQAALAKQLEPIFAWLEKYGISLNASLLSIFSPEDFMAFMSGLLGGVISNAVFLFFFLGALLLMLIGSVEAVEKFNQRLTGEHTFVREFTAYCKLIQKQYGIQTFSNFISGTAITIELLIIGVDFALLWGLLAFVFGYIPNVGLLLATIPAAVLAFIEFGPWTALMVLVIAAILNQIMDNVVTPRFMGKGLDMPITFVFLSFLFWTWMFGAFGTLISLPVTLALRSVFSSNKETQLLSSLLTAMEPNEPAVAPVKVKQRIRSRKGR